MWTSPTEVRDLGRVLGRTAAEWHRELVAARAQIASLEESVIKDHERMEALEQIETCFASMLGDETISVAVKDYHMAAAEDRRVHLRVDRNTAMIECFVLPYVDESESEAADDGE